VADELINAAKVCGFVNMRPWISVIYDRDAGRREPHDWGALMIEA
jgi:hypothetical protein